jgi:hypothetical protein
LDRELDYNDKKLDPHKGVWTRKSYNLTEEEVRYVMSITENNRQAFKYLKIRPETWRKYASRYIDKETGKSLFDLHKKGNHVFTSTAPKATALEVINGRKHTHSKEKLQQMLIEEGLMVEECHICGFNERRITDYKVPLMLMWKDGNKDNCVLDNMELVCFNHAYLYYNKTGPNMSLQNRDHGDNPTWAYVRAEYRHAKNEKDNAEFRQRLEESDLGTTPE